MSRNRGDSLTGVAELIHFTSVDDQWHGSVESDEASGGLIHPKVGACD